MSRVALDTPSPARRRSSAPGTTVVAGTDELNRAQQVGGGCPLLLGGILVCGGRSRRMGRDKARLVLSGKPMIERSAGLLGQLCTHVVLACGPEPRYEDLGLPLALDEVADGGPLAGIVAGLEALDTCDAIAIACDLPRLTPDLLRSLVAFHQEQDLDVCFLATEGGREPLCAVYSQKALPAMREALGRGLRKVTSFLEIEGLGKDLRVGRLALDSLPLDPRSACNINTPEELEREENEDSE